MGLPEDVETSTTSVTPFQRLQRILRERGMGHNPFGMGHDPSEQLPAEGERTVDLLQAAFFMPTLCDNEDLKYAAIKIINAQAENDPLPRNPGYFRARLTRTVNTLLRHRAIVQGTSRRLREGGMPKEIVRCRYPNPAETRTPHSLDPKTQETLGQPTHYPEDVNLVRYDLVRPPTRQNERKKRFLPWSCPYAPNKKSAK